MQVNDLKRVMDSSAVNGFIRAQYKWPDNSLFSQFFLTCQVVVFMKIKYLLFLV